MAVFKIPSASITQAVRNLLDATSSIIARNSTSINRFSTLPSLPINPSSLCLLVRPQSWLDNDHSRISTPKVVCRLTTTGSNSNRGSSRPPKKKKQRHLILKPSLINNAGQRQLSVSDSELLMKIDAALALSPDARLTKLRRSTTNTLQALLLQPNVRNVRRRAQPISSFASANSSANHIFIQADGVFLPDFGVGGAGIHFGGSSAQQQQHIVIPRMDPIILPYLESSFDADVQAVYAAVLIGQKVRGPGEHIVILTDSAVVVDKLADVVQTEWLELRHVDSILVGDAKRKARRAARRARKLLMERAVVGSPPPPSDSPLGGGGEGKNSNAGGGANNNGPPPSASPSSPPSAGGSASSPSTTKASLTDIIASSRTNNDRSSSDKW